MNKLEYYDRQKEPWGESELQKIITEYDCNEMTISQIADIHRRTPGSISYKVKGLGLIIHNTLARGYSEYKKSNLYKEIVNNAQKVQKAEKVRKDKTKTKQTIQTNISSLEINELRGEIKTIKNDVKEILNLINALYEFENKESD